MTPGNWRVTVISILFAVLWACLALLHRIFPSLKVEFPLREPPQISSTVPYVGHLIRIFIHKNHYYTKLSKRFQFPILKLPILGGQLYIIKSPKLIAAIERQPKVISFWHVEASAIGRVAGLRPDAAEKVSHGVGDNPDSFWLKGLRAIHHAMAPGEAINNMLLEAAQTSAETLSQFDGENRGKRVDLWEWVSHEITLSHTNAVYGQRNPYKDPQVEAAFWAFSRGSWKLLFGNLSKVLAPKARSGREKVVAAIKSYFLNFNPQTTSPLMEARMANMSMLEIEDMARMECVNGLGILANTVPSAFWTIVQVYSQPKLLERVRDLAAAAVIVVTDEENAIAGAEKRKKRKKIDIIRLQRSQQQIQSIVQEVIRLRTTGIGPRLVREDVLLHDQYLLKKGSIVVIPNRAVHFDPDIWGSDVEKFDEKRFAKPPPNSHDRHTNKASNKVSSTAYRGFGGGATICPGKHFAIEGIAVFVALVVLKYDIRPAKGERGWGFLGQKMRDMALQLGSPRGKFRVELLLREGIGDVEWGFGL